MRQPATTPEKLFWMLNALLGAAFVADLALPGFSAALDATVIALAAGASIAALRRRLPLQNVLPAALITALIGGVAHGLSSNPDICFPFGRVVFSPASGGKIFDAIPWTIPLLWIVAIFNARGVGRLILRPWRKIRNYGFWLIGLTVVLAVAFDFALEPFAWHAKHFWLWQPTKIAVTWQGATLLNFLGWIFVSLLILLFITPSLIRKQPGGSSAPEYHPLILWLGALLWFAAGSAEVGLWWPVVADAVIAVVSTIFAVRGAKW
jgi:uncharacterized membrane protein